MHRLEVNKVQMCVPFLVVQAKCTIFSTSFDYYIAILFYCLF